MADIGPHNSVGGYNSNEVNWDAFYQGMYGGPTQVANQPVRPAISPAQLAAIKSVPSGSYRSPPNAPIQLPNIPAGSQYADTGNKGRAGGSMLEQLMLAGLPPQQAGRPAWTIPQVPAPLPPNVQLPRPRPGYAPTAIDMAAINRPPIGANPGMGGAMIGNGVMSPRIPPQGPPPPGIAPTVWAGDAPAVPSAPAPRQPSLTGANAYELANWHAQQAALARQANATGTAGGYQYLNGQRVGYAPQTIGGTTYAPNNGASAYGLANVAGQIAALNRQAGATGSTGVYNYINGVKTGTVNGMSSANAYAAANAGPGSVAAFEQVASGRPAGSYSDGREPSGTGSLW